MDGRLGPLLDVCCVPFPWPEPYNVYCGSINYRDPDPLQHLKTKAGSSVPWDTWSVRGHLDRHGSISPSVPLTVTLPVSWIPRGQAVLQVPQRGTTAEDLRAATPLSSVIRWVLLWHDFHKRGNNSQQRCSTLTQPNSTVPPKKMQAAMHTGEIQTVRPPPLHEHAQWPRIP